MKNHLSNPNALPDEQFIQGEIRHLVVGNRCRLKDKRRTPGVITAINPSIGRFEWEISDFEDKGKTWEVNFEGVLNYQFEKDSRELTDEEVEHFQSVVELFSKKIQIFAIPEEKQRTQNKMAELNRETSRWLLESALFLQSQQELDLQKRRGPKNLALVFQEYMRHHSLLEVENKTATLQVLNPNSGDWILGMKITMAELGIKSYLGPAPRCSTVFEGEGSKAMRSKYVLHRLSFVRTMFHLFGISHVQLARGLASELPQRVNAICDEKFWSSWTFSFDVAKEFSEMPKHTQSKFSYFVTKEFSIEKIFMTFLETEAMNQQYLEAEAIVLHSEEDRLLW